MTSLEVKDITLEDGMTMETLVEKLYHHLNKADVTYVEDGYILRIISRFKAKEFVKTLTVESNNGNRYCYRDKEGHLFCFFEDVTKDKVIVFPAAKKAEATLTRSI